jgi:O-antigen ligase
VLNPAAALYEPDRPGLLISGQLSGVYADKAILAIFSVASLLIVTFLPGVIPVRGGRTTAQAILAITLLLTNSASAMAGAAVGLGVLFIARSFPRFAGAILGGALLVTAIVAGVLPFTGAGDIAELMGRSPDLTGRGEFWPLAPGLIGEQPALGYGYMSFFTNGPTSPAWRVWNIESSFWTPNFHNTWLDVLIGLGIVGGIGYGLMLLATVLTIAFPAMERRTADVLGAIMLLLVLNSATEFSFLYHNRLSTLLLFYCVLIGGRSAVAAFSKSTVRNVSRNERLSTGTRIAKHLSNAVAPQRPLMIMVGGNNAESRIQNYP